MVSKCAKCKTTILWGAVIDNEGRNFCGVTCKDSVHKRLLAPLPPDGSLPSTEGTLIYCWPYCPATDGQTVKREKDPVFLVVTMFGGIWLLTLLITCHFNMWGNVYMFFKWVPFLFLPLLGLGRGTTHIRVNQTGIVLESASGKSIMKSKPIPWRSILRIYVEKPKEGQSILCGKLVIKHSSTEKVSLSKIASADQWKKLVEAINVHFDSKLDSSLLDVLIDDASRDPSYTKLWLDALTAPPRRTRLQPLVSGTSLQKGQYTVERLLGNGGQGSAYLARSGSNDLIVLKEYILPVYVDVRVRKQALEDFENEARLLTSLRDDGIVKCLTSFVEDHRAYLVLEYVSGRSLRDLVEAGGCMSESDCMKHAIAMAKILHYLHTQSPPIVHRDFTPDNLLVCNSSQSLKLIDFMVAQKEGTETSQIVGKHHYMPPEQFRGQAIAASDLYALGCTMHFLLTGQDPEPMTPSHPMLVNEAISPEIDEIVARLTALDARFRYRDAGELVTDMQTRSIKPTNTTLNC
jgi:tRNA A-37 threonylcarbamoyl transferase component Bud32